jgi:hypothetical protein
MPDRFDEQASLIQLAAIQKRDTLGTIQQTSEAVVRTRNGGSWCVIVDGLQIQSSPVQLPAVQKSDRLIWIVLNQERETEVRHTTPSIEADRLQINTALVHLTTVRKRDQPVPGVLASEGDVAV